MVEHVRFHFDPICPWCYQTSRWIHQLVGLGEVRASWGVFSLELVNAGSEESLRKRHARSAPALRTCVVVDEEAGSDALGDFYAALGARVHEKGEPLEEAATITSSLSDAGLSTTLHGQALADEASWDRVRAHHEALRASTRSFGVPTIVLDGGEGPAIFGPVISEVPTDDEAVELLQHVAWLTRYEGFSELKRDRTIDPPLESFRRARRGS